MKIRITDIGPKGLKVKDNIPLDALNKRMNEAKSNDIIFTESPAVDLLVHKTPNGAQVKGTAKGKYTQPCSRCVMDLNRETEVPVDFVFQRRTPIELAKSTNDDDTFYDDIGICYFYGEHIELEELIQECLILSLDPYYKPPQDEKGNCITCGRDCKTSVSLD